MRKLAFIFLLLSQWAFGTASVSGKLVTPDGSALPLGSFAQFDLKNCGGNYPTVAGASITSQKIFNLAADGTWSGTLYRNDEIGCNGSYTTWWRLSYWVKQAQSGPARDFLCSQSSCVFDGTGGLTPITVYPPPISPQPPAISLQPKLCSFPVAASTWTCTHNFGVQPTQVQFRDLNWKLIVPDNDVATDVNTETGTFLQPQAGYMIALYAGNSTLGINNPNYLIGNPTSSQSVLGDYPFTLGGSLSAKRVFQSDTGIFTTGQMNDEGTFLLNGLSPLTEYQASVGSVYSTNALIGGLTIPNSSAVQSASGVAAFVNNGAGPSGTVGLATFTQCRDVVVGARCWGINSVAVDTAGLASNVYLNAGEFDVQPMNPPSAYAGATGGIAGPNAFLISSQSGNFGGEAFGAYTGGTGHPQWGSGFQSNDGASAAAFIAGLSAIAAPSTDSQNSQWVMEDSGSTKRTATATFRSTGIFEFALPSAVANSAFKVLGGLSAYGTGTGAPACAAANVGAWLDSGNLRLKECSNGGSAQNVTIAGVDINANDQVVATHLAAALPVNQGGTGQTTLTPALTVGTGNVTTAGTAVTNGTSQAQTNITVTNALTSDSCIANIGAALPATWQTGIQFRCDVVSANTVTVNLLNPTAGSITPVATQINVRVVR